jgi:hypothetical protein
MAAKDVHQLLVAFADEPAAPRLRCANAACLLALKQAAFGRTRPPDDTPVERDFHDAYLLISAAPDPVVAPLLRNLAERLLAGASFLSVCRIANESGVKPPRSDRWRVTTLRTALTGNPIVGRYTYRGDLVRNEDGTPKQVWEPVLDLQTWHALKANLSQRAKSLTAKRSHNARGRLLSGLAACKCGNSLHLHRNSNGTLSYRCSGPQSGTACPTRVSVLCDRLEEYVVGQVLPVLRHLPIEMETESKVPTAELADVLDAITATSIEFSTPGADYAAMGARMAALQERRAMLETAARVAPRTTLGPRHHVDIHLPRVAALVLGRHAPGLDIRCEPADPADLWIREPVCAL